jgi:hypothetical protein
MNGNEAGEEILIDHRMIAFSGNASLWEAESYLKICEWLAVFAKGTENRLPRQPCDCFAILWSLSNSIQH